MGGFLTGAVGGYANVAAGMKEKGKKGLLRRGGSKIAPAKPSSTPTSETMGPNDQVIASPSTFKRGGKVRKSGWAKVHKGEKVIPASKAKGTKRTKGKGRRGRRGGSRR